MALWPIFQTKQTTSASITGTTRPVQIPQRFSALLPSLPGRNPNS